MWRTTSKAARRIVIAGVGLSVVLVGVAMMVLPGPAIVVIPAGLAILATEFVWARRLLDRFREHAERGAGWVTSEAWKRRRKQLQTGPAPSADHPD